MIHEIQEKLNSLSEEAQAGADQKARELNLDTNKAGIPLTESFINLNLTRGMLDDAIKKNKLVQLPITLQRQLNERLDDISRHLKNQRDGSDEIVNLTNSIENLSVLIWQWGLHNLSDEFLGYQTKLNQIKQLEVEIQNLRADLQKGLGLKNTLADAVVDAQKTITSLKDQLQTAEASKKLAEENSAKTTDAQNKSAAALAIIQANEQASTDQKAKTSASASEVGAMEEKIRDFFKAIDDYRKKTDDLSKDAATTVSKNSASVGELLKKLSETEAQIREQIVRATGFSLFHSFDTRKAQLSKGKMFWVGALGFLLAVTIGLTIYIAESHKDFDSIFYLKLSASIPLALAITFCTLQYSRERRLEEEYAFKGNISISLKPYQELIEKIVDKSVPGEREKYAQFMIDSANKVFTSPTERIFESSSGQPGDIDHTEKTLKHVAGMVKIVAKSLK